MSQEERDFEEASMVAGLPLMHIFLIIAFFISVFGLKLFWSVNEFNPDYPPSVIVDEVYFLTIWTTILLLPTLVIAASILATLLAVLTGRADVDYWKSLKLTWQLQRMLVRQVGSDVGAQGRIAKLSNIRRLKSFVWVRKASGKVIVAVRLTGRADVDNLVDQDQLSEIADDLAEMLVKTHSTWQKFFIQKKLTHQKYLVCSMG